MAAHSQKKEASTPLASFGDRGRMIYCGCEASFFEPFSFIILTEET